MKLTRFILLGSVLCAALAAHAVSDAESEKDAIAAAESWLKLTDAGDYARSWEEASSVFREAVSQEDWEKSIRAARAPLGEVVSRKLESAEYATSLPGAPDGNYVVIRFATSFAKKEAAVETVTPRKDEDGTWRVSGYYIK